MRVKRLLLGDEALALGALHAGLSGVYAYPGTPSTEITEFIQGDPLARERGVRSRWCTNEKTAMEAALGMSYAGKRALVCMKHVGMNVCADAFVNAAITVILSDNLTTAMTGGQDSAGTHKFEAICLALGVEREHLHVVVPLPKNMDEITRIIREEVEYRGVSVIIPQRECMQTLARKNRQKKAAQ